MVHGLWGEPSAFNEMEHDLIFSGLYPLYNYSSVLSPLLLKIDYKVSNSYSFASNANVIPDNIDKILKRARDNNYSAGKVDIVAHSMGGILARQYIQSYSHYHDREDVHKLITLNTPHSGSQAANLKCCI
ncbi:MAG: alpha/beta hydrolase [Bacteroidia bacterium]|nr:alpha/beta hydrolase [Bacteroidia bacterium]